MKTVWRVLVACTLVLPGMVHAVDLDCPRAIGVQQTPVRFPVSWEVVHADRKPLLRSVEFFDGHPSEGVILRPEGEPLQVKKETIETRKLWPNPDRGYWLVCTYEYTSVTLAKRIPSTVSECIMTYESDIFTASRAHVLKRVVCQ